LSKSGETGHPIIEILSSQGSSIAERLPKGPEFFAYPFCPFKRDCLWLIE
jgi:hypothetical protein